MPAVGIDTVQASMIVAALSVASGSSVANLVLQTAPVRIDNPDPWVLPATQLTVNGVNGNASAAIDISTQTVGKAWIRFGALFALAAGGTAPAAADVSLATASLDIGSMIGNWRGPLTATVSADAFVSVTGWVPSLLAQKVMAAIQVAAASANFQHRLVYRVATYTQNVPGGWTSISGETNQAGNAERNTGRLALTLGANMWVQFGLAYSSASGTSVADVAVSVGARRT